MMQHIYRYTLVFLFFLTTLTSLWAQETLPLDSICLTAGGPGFNIVTDDFPAGGEYTVQLEVGSGCIILDERGLLTIPADVSVSRCCGFQGRLIAFITFFGSNGQVQTFRQDIDLTIKCPKPDCGLVDLDEIPQPRPNPNPDEPQDIPCISACENSTATYLFSENMALTYVWQATNGTVDELPGLPGQIQVSWGSLGSTSLSVEIFDADGNLLTTRSYCVTLTEAPIADFTATSVACLGQDVYFTNASTGAAASYDWDFGDGNTAQNAATPTVTHAYDTPGTYTVTLVATSNGGLNADGSQACCCIDSVSYDIVIDPDPGPGIFWISTLCEGDASKYWTDATGCLDILWEISGNGTITSDPTLDTIMVDWGSGPSGTLELFVNDCDQDYCPTPSVAIVPIISTSGTISGPIEVCGGETANYSLPKWLTTEYTWILPDGGSFNGSNNGHTTSITWPTTPGTYEIVVEYGSSFLAGLPGHEGDDCYGRAVLEVTVLNNFTISAAPNPACVDGMTFFNAFTDGSPTLYNWSVVGYPGLDMLNQPNFAVDWSHPDLPGAGVYTIVAEVVNAADYCVAVRSVTVVVKDAVNPVISGPLDYCVGDPVIYTIVSPTPGYTYTWAVSIGDGSVTLGQGGPTATIVFTNPTATVSVYGQDSQAPNCISEVVELDAEEIVFDDPVTITGPPACTNSLADYTFGPVQHPDATYAWSVIPMTAGSVIAGSDETVATIQWNDDPGTVFVRVDISLCGNTIFDTLELELNAPIEPVITQLGDLCPDGSAKLFIDSTQFTTIVWDLGGNAGTVWAPNAGLITIFEEGSYVVNTIDVNGCPGVARIRVEDVPGPDISITTDSVRQICVNSLPFPNNPILEAVTDAGNTIEWFCGGDSQGPAAIGNTTFTHVWTTVPGTFTYFARVVDPVTGCTEDSDPLFISQRVCCGPPYVSDPISQIHTFEATRQSPNCDLIDLVATFSQDSVVGHGFNWAFLDAQIISVGGTTGRDSMTIRLPGVGCYDINHTIDVWAYDYDTTFIPGSMVIDEITKVDSIRCGKTLTRKVCNPLFADFDKREECGVVEFTDESDFDLPSPAPTITYTWNFGDGSLPSSDVNPVHEYGANGTYTVTLSITDGDCVSTSTMVVEVTDLPDTDFMVDPNPVCYGQPALFTGSGTNVIEWEWDFDDGASFNGNGPQHTFLPSGGSGSYDVTLITTNRAGCRDTVVKTIDVFPTPLLDTIEASPGFIICDGETTILSVDNIPGLSYEWSTGATTFSIPVSTAGTYGVTLTNADGCSQVIEPVEVQVIPLPSTSWIGNPFICDNGSTTLTALAGGGHSYLWENQTTGVTLAGSTLIVPFSSGNTFQDILLTVTNDAYGCSAEVLITVEQAVSPAPDAQITAGGDCEGDGSLIEVVNPEPGVTYTWNTGEEGLSIFTYAAGTYTVVATDVRTGCVGTDQVTINPLPDICIVPTGCYEICAPYTIYAPIGDYSYAWYMNGTLAGIVDSLVVTQPGSYSVTVIDNITGCASISDSLYLEVIDCSMGDCDDITTRLRRSDEETEIGDCCFELYYDGLPDDIYYIQVSSPDADLPLVPGSENPAFGHAANDVTNSFQLAVNILADTPIPSSMTTTPAVTFCPIDATAFPQQIIVDYYGANKQIVCSDTLYTECAVEPDCVYITADSLYCADDGTLIFDFTICNPSDADFSVGYVELLPGSPAAAAVLVSPANEFNLFPPLAPGDCRTITTTFPALPAGESFSYSLIGHSTNPNLDPSALCCSDPASARKLIIPDCDPCDNVGVREVSQNDGCCYDIFLFNNAPAPYSFDGVDLCLIGGDGTLNIYPAIGDQLTGTVGVGGQTVSVFTPDGTTLPNGVFALPTICLEGSQNLINLIEVKWLSDGGVVCRDTIEVRCVPPCGFLQEISVECQNDVYVWTGTITNTSPYMMSEAYIDFDDYLGLDAYNTTIVFGSVLNTGDSEVISIIIGSPAGPGDKVSFTVTLHETGPDDYHLNCCQFEACIELPDCKIEECTCDNEEQFQEDVNMGFDTIALPGVGPLAYQFDPRADFTGCDSIVWSVRRRNPNGPWQEIGSNQVQAYTFPARGRYQVWMRVYRYDDDEKLCSARNAFITYNIGNGFIVPGTVVDTGTRTAAFDVDISPNPAVETIQVTLPGGVIKGNKVNMNVYDFRGRLTNSYSWDNVAPSEEQVFQISVSDLPSGVYVLRGTSAEGQPWSRRFVRR
ncbi:PKD domain-containing protein [Neolewinella persica]|uniref:PKD domain-containing protein n=1 Tax=Neolewinella persica TaxID=70998 RepID=UPI0003A58D82|nr:PKD domain-containing protein [Neolewinella persica]